MKKIIILSFLLTSAISLTVVSPAFAKIRMVDGVLSTSPDNSALLNSQKSKTIFLSFIISDPRGSMEIFSYPIVPNGRDGALLFQEKPVRTKTYAYGYNPQEAGDMKTFDMVLVTFSSVIVRQSTL